MKLTHKQKVKKARQMRNRVEESTYLRNGERKRVTPLFRSHKWLEQKMAKTIKLRNKVALRRAIKANANKSGEAKADISKGAVLQPTENI